MSGRSVGCEDYPGGRLVTYGDYQTKENRRDVLENLWHEDPALALSYVERWNANYLDLYRRLRAAIDRPTALPWISNRDPSGWKPKLLLKKLNLGLFPQLVGRELYYSVAALFYERFEHVAGLSSEQPRSRSTGEPCPYFGAEKKLRTEFHYYPSTESHARLAETLAPWAGGAARALRTRVGSGAFGA